MPDKYRAQWVEHIDNYVKHGWWNPGSLDSACALFAIPKKEPGIARFVINLKPHNSNTVKMHTPIPEMRYVQDQVADAPFRSAVDFAAAFEQVRVVPQHVDHTSFTTTTGTHTSRVMQFGDANVPDMLNQVTSMMLAPCVGRFLTIFFDDVRLFSGTRCAHLCHIHILLTSLRWNRFYLRRAKSEWFSKLMLSLGSLMTDDGISVIPRSGTAFSTGLLPSVARTSFNLRALSTA